MFTAPLTAGGVHTSSSCLLINLLRNKDLKAFDVLMKVSALLQVNDVAGVCPCFSRFTFRMLRYRCESV